MSSETEDGLISHAVQILLAIAFGSWAWVVKVAASRHLDSVERIEHKVDALAERVTKLETRMSVYHGDAPRN